MSEHTENGHHSEIVIVRRKHGDHDGHHGGAWKIAYADFVTAMMAFFLVMWLVNSANEATRAKVASYFNPIKMTDPSPAGKGLKETPNPKHTDSKSSQEASSSAEKTGDAANSKDGGKTEDPNVAAQKSEEEMMHDPYKAIDSISTEGAGKPSGREVDIVSEKAGDPFDPKAWETLREGKKSSETSQEPAMAQNGEVNDKEPSASQMTSELFPPLKGAETTPGETDNIAPKLGGLTDAATDGSTATKNVTDGKGTVPNAADVTAEKSDATTADKVAAATPDQVMLKDRAVPANPTQDKPAKADQATQVMKDADAAIVAQTQKAITEAAKVAGVTDALNASVKMTSEGLLIVLADKTGSSMFEIGSAAPTPPLVAVVEAIGKILETQQGKVVIRGHTDARQYHSLKFDNWQLSTSRAHMASYMLLKGGFDEARIDRIEGYGATSPIEGSDPLDAENRRVEFLLKR